MSYLQHSIQKQPYKGVLIKRRSEKTQNYTEHPCRSVISTVLQSNFIIITFQYGCSVILLDIFRTPVYKNTFRGLLQPISTFSFVTVDAFCEVSEIFRSTMKKNE